MRWRIRHKLAAGLFLIVGMTGVLSAGSFYGLYSYRHSNKVFNHHQQQLERLGNLDHAVSGLNFPSRDADDAPDNPDLARKEKLERLDRVSDLLLKYRTGLEQAFAASFTKQGIMKQMGELERMSQLVEELRASVDFTGPVAAANSASEPRPFWFTINEREVIARLVYSLNVLRGVIHAEVTDHVAADRANYRASLAIVYSTTVLVVVMLCVTVWLGYGAIFHPIRELHVSVLKLSKGDFTSHVKIDSGDEVQELGEAFNTMADKLSAMYSNLNKQVEDRSRQLIRSERLASVGFLAAGVAHEINNPLASIAFCGEAIENRFGQVLPKNSPDTEVLVNYVQMIQQEAFRCKAITEKLLDFSRTGEPERSDTDVVALIRSVIEMVQHLGRSRGRDLLFEPHELVIARVNPQELKQVLLNLVINGLESTDEGGKVHIEAKRLPEGRVSITVRDNGIGMTDEVKTNLFEPFFTRNRTGKGTGLGLSISHLIISQHGGTLTAESAGPGRGSSMTVVLPAGGQTETQRERRAA